MSPLPKITSELQKNNLMERSILVGIIEDWRLYLYWIYCVSGRDKPTGIRVHVINVFKIHRSISI